MQVASIIYEHSNVMIYRVYKILRCTLNCISVLCSTQGKYDVRWSIAFPRAMSHLVWNLWKSSSSYRAKWKWKNCENPEILEHQFNWTILTTLQRYWIYRRVSTQLHYRITSWYRIVVVTRCIFTVIYRPVDYCI